MGMSFRSLYTIHARPSYLAVRVVDEDVDLRPPLDNSMCTAPSGSLQLFQAVNIGVQLSTSILHGSRLTNDKVSRLGARSRESWLASFQVDLDAKCLTKSDLFMII